MPTIITVERVLLGGSRQKRTVELSDDGSFQPILNSIASLLRELYPRVMRRRNLVLSKPTAPATNTRYPTLDRDAVEYLRAHSQAVQRASTVARTRYQSNLWNVELPSITSTAPIGNASSNLDGTISF